MRRFFQAWLVAAGVLTFAGAARAAAKDGYFRTSDGVRLHFLQEPASNGARGPVLVFVPGWTMPAWIWQRQLDFFSQRYPVVALDPRGQGDSDVPATGYEPDRRGRDIGDLLALIAPRRVVLVGWSLGVLDSLAYVHEYGDAQLAGLVLVDNSVGEAPAPVARRGVRPLRRAPPASREAYMAGFVRSMFRVAPDETYLDRLTQYALRTPAADAAALLAYPVPRTYWRDALYMVRKPVLYIVRPQWEAQAETVARRDPYAETALFTDAGHALFVDDAERFDQVVQDFLTRRVTQ